MVEVTKESGLLVAVDENDHVLGRSDAPLTLVEYGDFQCPYCRQADRALGTVREQMGDRLRYVFREFPLPAHADAWAAATAAEAAAGQGKFWQMSKLLFANQSELDDESLNFYAKELGLDMTRFTRDRDSDTCHARIQRDKDGGLESGVQGTPTFFINGVAFEGAWDADSLVTALRAASD